MTQLDYWTNCYDMNWKNLITPAAFSHPAKFSHGLIKRIYDHALQDGLIQPGGVVLDPFGGVGLGALYAMQNGFHWVGVELESKFVELGRENIALWNARYAAHFPNWGSAQVLQGDSRRLAEVVGAAGLVVSSPPYADSINSEKNGIDWKKVKKDYPGREMHEARIKMAERHHNERRYGETDGQLGAMKPGIPPAALISSPPFAGNTGGRGEASRNGIDAALFDRHSGGMKKGTGDDPANLDHLPMGDFSETVKFFEEHNITADDLAQFTKYLEGIEAVKPTAIVSSPPYADVVKGGEGPGARSPKWVEENCNDYDIAARDNAGKLVDYGSTDGQLGAMKPGALPCSSAPLPPCIVSSPPFADSVGSDDPDKRGGLFRDEKRRNDVNLTGTYGETEGQLGGMKAGAVIGSPPFENSIPVQDVEFYKKQASERGRNPNSVRINGGFDYGSTDGQIGATQGQTFWEAAALIVSQCYDILPPNAYAIWVVKNYIKAGREVDFTGQWQALCEACGFETVHIHRAMLVKENGEQATMAAGHDTTGTTTNLLGEEVTTAGKALANKKNRTERKSFFRRLHERRRPDLAIDFETVLCMRKAASPKGTRSVVVDT